MSNRYTSETIEATSQRFVLRYRCLGCGQVVKGHHVKEREQAVCENCHASLDENDQIVQSAAAPYPPAFAEEELG